MKCRPVRGSLRSTDRVSRGLRGGLEALDDVLHAPGADDRGPALRDALAAQRRELERRLYERVRQTRS